MTDLSQVLRQKEMDIERVRKEIKALHFVIPLLAEDADRFEPGLASRSVSPLGGSGTASVKGSHEENTNCRADLPASCCIL